MKIDQFLRHHGITGNPFSEEDAQTDTIFKRGCLWKIHHPAWDKFFGSPADPSTALVFGEKGSGKTALRLQSEAEFEAYNDTHPRERVFVVSYDDFNPFLDHFRESVRARDAGEALTKFRLQDHMDAILALSTTKLVDQLTSERVDLSPLSLDQRRDLLLLAALYDQSTGESIEHRWSRLRRRSGFRPLWSRRDLQIGVGTTVFVVALTLMFRTLLNWSVWPWVMGALVAGWVYWIWRLARADWFAREIRKGIRVLGRDPSALRWELLWFKPSELGGQPLPAGVKAGAEERYELLRKFQGVLQSLGYRGIVVLIDRVDEPQLIEGDPRKMRALVWPLLDHKFLRHPGIGVKLLLPIELAYYLEKEDKEFYDRARPDKLNMIKPLRWTGPSLYDLAGDRLRVCRVEPSANGEGPRLRQFIDESIPDDSLKDALGHLRTPRQLFKFLHRLLEEHCHRHTEDSPRWSIDADTFRAVYTSHMRDIDAFDRGYGHG
ncbi:MAG: hypothetical protein NVSMB14_06560 [Isosphaeraceae bacterium]